MLPQLPIILPSNTWYNANGTLNGVFSEEWVSMSQSEALDFYTPYEICKAMNGGPLAEGCNEEPGILTPGGCTIDQDSLVHSTPTAKAIS